MDSMRKIGIVVLFCNNSISSKLEYYNNQEIGLARALSREGFEVTIFYPSKNVKTPIEKAVDDVIKVVFVPCNTIGVHSKFDWNIIKKYNIYYVRLAGDNQLFAPECIKYCEKNRIKVCNYIGTINSDSKNAFKKILLGLMFRRNIKFYKKHKCFAKNIEVQNDLKNRGILDVELAPVGLDITDIRRYSKDSNIQEELKIPRNKTCVLYVGAMKSYKRPLEALEFLKINRNCVFMIMIGTGPLNEKVDDFINKNNLEDCIKRIEKVSNNEIHKYYGLCDYFLNFNRNEIIGMSILEAMYQGKTVIAFKAPGPNMIIDNEKTGFLVNNIEEMTKIINSKLILNSYDIIKNVETNYSWNETAAKIINWIMEEEKNEH